jgi:hypothetical protein
VIVVRPEAGYRPAVVRDQACALRAKSQENQAVSQDHRTRSQAHRAKSQENLARSQENLARSQENLAMSQENLAMSRQLCELAHTALRNQRRLLSEVAAQADSNRPWGAEGSEFGRSFVELLTGSGVPTDAPPERLQDDPEPAEAVSTGPVPLGPRTDQLGHREAP